MFVVTLKTLFRNLYQDKLYSFINMLGMSVSFASFLIIFLFITNEVTRDQHFKHHDNIYRLGSQVLIDGVETHHAKVGSLVAPLLAQDYEAFSSYVRMNPIAFGGSVAILREDINIQWDDRLVQADNSIFDIFNHNIVAGNPKTALLEPRTLAISQSAANLYFGDEDPIGQTLSIVIPGNDHTVTLVFEDLPENTSLQYDILFSNNNVVLSGENDSYFEDGIVWFNDYTYFLLPDNFNLSSIDSISDDFFARYIAGPSARMFEGQNVSMDFVLQPLDDIYFAEAWDEDLPKGNVFNVMALSAVAIFILLVASINYMNLSTARFSRRAKEVAVRRIVGAEKRNVVLHFVYEGLFFSGLAMLIGFCLVEILLSTNYMSDFLGSDLHFSLWQNPVLLLQVLSVCIFVGLFSSAYPALYFAAIKPNQVLKLSLSSSSFRGVLISLQMFVSVAVIASALIMFLQVNFLKNRSLGFDKEQKIDVEANLSVSGNEYRAVVQRLSSHPNVNNVSMVEFVPGSNVSHEPVVMLSDDGLVNNPQLNWYVADEFYLETLGVELISGMNFPPISVDAESVVEVPLMVNQSLVDFMGWDEPIGQTIEFQVSDIRGRVIGVFSDFNYRPLYEKIEPLAILPFYNDYRWPRHLIIDYQLGSLEAVALHIETVMKDFEPGFSFPYQFIDQKLDALYQAERTQQQLIGAGSAICILIAILGLLGLSVFILDQKTKEIGIRRVLGATITAIITLLFRRIIILIAFSAICSSLMVQLVMTRWLQSFAYHIQINQMVYLVATAIVLLLAVLTIVLQTTRVLKVPVTKALRYE